MHVIETAGGKLAPTVGSVARCVDQGLRTILQAASYRIASVRRLGLEMLPPAAGVTTWCRVDLSHYAHIEHRRLPNGLVGERLSRHALASSAWTECCRVCRDRGGKWLRDETPSSASRLYQRGRLPQEPSLWYLPCTYVAATSTPAGWRKSDTASGSSGVLACIQHAYTPVIPGCNRRRTCGGIPGSRPDRRKKETRCWQLRTSETWAPQRARR